MNKRNAHSKSDQAEIAKTIYENARDAISGAPLRQKQLFVADWRTGSWGPLNQRWKRPVARLFWRAITSERRT